MFYSFNVTEANKADAISACSAQFAAKLADALATPDEELCTRDLPKAEEAVTAFINTLSDAETAGKTVTVYVNGQIAKTGTDPLDTSACFLGFSIYCTPIP